MESPHPHQKQKKTVAPQRCRHSVAQTSLCGGIIYIFYLLVTNSLQAISDLQATSFQLFEKFSTFDLGSSST